MNSDINIKTGILYYGSHIALHHEDEVVYLQHTEGLFYPISRLEFIKGLSNKDLEKKKFDIFTDAIIRNRNNIVNYLLKLKFIDEELDKLCIKAVKNKRFDIFRLLCKTYNYVPEDWTIIEYIYRYGKPEDLDFAYEIGLYEDTDDAYDLLEESIKYGNLETIKHTQNYLEFGREYLNRLITKCQHKEVYKYLLSQGADKLMISEIGKKISIDFVKYLYNLGLRFRAEHLLGILKYKKGIEIIDFLISKGYEFDELLDAFEEDESIIYLKPSIYLLKLGYAEDYYMKDLMLSEFLTQKATLKDLEFISDITVKLDDRFKLEIVKILRRTLLSVIFILIVISLKNGLMLLKRVKISLNYYKLKIIYCLYKWMI